MTLIGYSMGAKVIFYCLKEMHRQLCLSDAAMSPSPSSDELREAATADDAGDDDDDLQADLGGSPDDPRGPVAPEDRPDHVPTAATTTGERSYFGFFRKKNDSSNADTHSSVDAMRGKGLIQDVVLLGCPINSKVTSACHWQQFHSSKFLASSSYPRVALGARFVAW